MADVVSSVSRIQAYEAAGILTGDEAWLEIAQCLTSGVHRDDPELERVARGLAAGEDIGPAAIAELGAFAQWYAARPSGRSSSRERLGRELRESLTARVGRAISGEESPGRAVELVAALPSDWCTLPMLTFIAGADLDGEDRRRLDRHLLPAAVRLRGAPQAFEGLVRPHLRAMTTDAARLLVDAYLQPGLAAGHRAALIEHLRAQAQVCSTGDLLRLVVRLSAEGSDEHAVPLAAGMARRGDLPPVAPPVIGLVLWLGGAREQGRAAAQLEPAWSDPFGWATQASRAVAAFLAATVSDPPGVLALCSVGADGEHSVRSVAAVGALVGRLALMRMRAHLALGHVGEAVREARAVVSFHGYRGYDLHAQVPEQEFEVALTDRLTVTSEELGEAVAVLESAGPAETDLLVLSEGVLALRAVGPYQ